MSKSHLHLAYYGNAQITRAYCDDCENMALVIKNKLQCCDRAYLRQPERMKRISEPWYGRRLPPKADREAILAAQMNCCFYCDRRFGSQVFRGARLVALRCVWDHQIPWIYSQNNSADNFVAACQICNGIKSDRVFASPDEARVHIQNRWIEKGITDELVSTGMKNRDRRVLEPAVS